MKRFFQIILFVLASILEVEVRASDSVSLPLMKEPLQAPEGCLKTSSACILRTVGKVRFPLKLENGEISMLEATAIERAEDQSWRILEGTVVVSSEGNLMAKLKFADVKLKGTAIIRQTKAESLIQTVTGLIQYRPLGHRSDLKLDQGYEVRVSGVRTNGEAQVSFPKAWDLRETVRRLAQAHEGSVEQFQSRWDELGLVWRSAVRNSSFAYREVYNRTLASIHQQEVEEKRRVEQIQREREFYRELMWKRQFEER